ncbi:hypothetical protein MKY31_30390 [Bacillus sp. FSL M8-0139]|uniref:hypothetical protein n=1 Tax=Bacillus sp. FSL M8-0139 TaxID=2921613 RepID=UPI0030F4FC9C
MELEQVVRKYETDLLRLPYVVGVGMGFVQEKEVIQVFVSKKVPRSQLKAAEQIPTQLVRWYSKTGTQYRDKLFYIRGVSDEKTV